VTGLKTALRVVVIVLLIVLVAPTGVGAHAEVLGSSPGSGDTVGGEITRIEIVFAETVTDAFVEVTGPRGVLAGSMVQAQGLVVGFGLDEEISDEGDYRVVFEFDSLDDDFVELEFMFTYEQGAPEPLAVAASSTSKTSAGLSTVAIAALATSTVGLAALLAWRYRQLSNRR